MARPGVTYAEISEAASHLLGQGKNPTIEQIRHFLGTGSSTTIAAHLKKWKEQQQSTSLLSAKESIPLELIEMVKGLWDRVIGLSQEKMLAVEASYSKNIAEVEQVAEKYKTNNQRWQQLFNQWQQEKEKLSADKLSLEQAVHALQKDRSELQVTLSSHKQQIDEKQQRITELHQLHKQSQDNLEHYREASREQRLLEQQQFEQQKITLQDELKLSKEQSTLLHANNTKLQQLAAALELRFQQLENTNDKQLALIEQQKQQISVLDKAMHENQHACKHWQQQYETAQKSLDEKTLNNINLQTELKVITTQLSEAKMAVKELHEQNKFISHEKWLLAEEKAQLEGQFKQMQTLVTA